MFRLSSILIQFFLIICISMFGKVEKPTQVYTLSKETVRIQGFSQYPNTTFYHISARSIRRIIINRITGDAITVNTGVQGSMQYISWDTSLSTLAHGVELSGEDNPGIIQYLRLYRNDYKPKALEVPFYPPCRKINQITSYFKLSRHQQNSNKDFGLNLYKRVYSAGDIQIAITDKFNDMKVIIEKLTHQPEIALGNVISADEAKTIRAYADSLKSRDIKSLYIFRKGNAANQNDKQTNNIDKPHGILQLQVSGFESFPGGRFHLLIVGEDGLICKRIRGNSVKLKLNSDEKGYLTRSRYWDREKKGVLFDLSSKQYKHYKSNLHLKNRNDEPMIRIPTYLINDEIASEVYQFIVVSQLSELAKTKDDFVIKLKESHGKDIVNLSTGLKTLSEGYHNTSRMPYILNFLAVLIISLLIKYLILFVLYNPVCHTSGWVIKLKLFYTCFSGAFLTLSAIWFLVPLIQNLVLIKLIVSFVFTILIEGVIYSGFLRIKPGKALLLAVCCNIVFYATGLLFF